MAMTFPLLLRFLLDEDTSYRQRSPALLLVIEAIGTIYEQHDCSRYQKNNHIGAILLLLVLLLLVAVAGVVIQQLHRTSCQSADKCQ